MKAIALNVGKIKKLKKAVRFLAHQDSGTIKSISALNPDGSFSIPRIYMDGQEVGSFQRVGINYNYSQMTEVSLSFLVPTNKIGLGHSLTIGNLDIKSSPISKGELHLGKSTLNLG